MADNDFDMQPVESDNLAEVGFNEDTNQGRIRFVKGSLYEYDDCTLEEAEQIRNAPSANDAFKTLWRGLKPYRKIE